MRRVARVAGEPRTIMGRIIDRRRVLLGAAGLSLATASPALAQSLTNDPTPVRSGRFAGASRYSAERNGLGVLVMRHGVILAEEYTGGADERLLVSYGAASKAFAPILAAGLVRDRLMTLDEPVSFSIPEWSADPIKALITIRHLLQQVSGLTPSAPGAPSPSMAEAVARPSQFEPGNVFAEDNTGLQVFAEAARRKLVQAQAPSDPGNFLALRALDAVGVWPLTWSRQSDGLIDLAGGASGSLRALAQLGEFIRRRGLWRASFRVSPQTLDAAMVGTLVSRGRVGMGGWRRADGMALASGETASPPSDLWGAPDLPSDTLFIASLEGVRLFIVPSRAVVAARAGQDASGQPWSDAAFLRAVLNES